MGSQCRHCARALAHGEVCGRCLTSPLSIGIAIAPLVYERDAARLVHELKFQNNRRATKTLAQALIDAVEATYADTQRPEVVVPTPMAWRRHVVRGYNQAERLARSVARPLRLPVASLLRRRYGPTQHGRSRAARETLPLRTFSFTDTRRFSASVPEHIALIDDVMTTGTTMRTMARVCADAGVRRVDLWAVCRAVAPEDHTT